MQASWAFGLPCPWAPLQSFTTAASRRIPCSHRATGEFAGQSHHVTVNECYVSGFGSQARGPASRAFVVERASPIGSEAGVLEACESALCWSVAEAAVRHGTQSQVTAHTRTSSQRASPEPEPKRGDGCFFEARCSTEAESTATKLPCLEAHSRSGERPRGFPRGLGSESAHRSGLARDLPPGGCLPPTSHRGGAPAQDTQREFDDVSHGVRLLSAYEPRRSLCRFASPTPSALGVSHSLSGLIPPGPCGFVSRHIRP